MSETTSYSEVAGTGARHEPVLARYPELAGRVAIVTGAAGGIGTAFVEGLSAQGVHVLAADLDISQIKQLDSSPRDAGTAGSVKPYGIDVTSPKENAALVTTAAAEYGRLDFFIGNAGIYPSGTAFEVGPEQLLRTIDVNVAGLMAGAQAAAEIMQPGSAIVTMSSVNATKARQGRLSYSISKAAVEHLTRALAVDYADRGIRVNAIAPGFVDTAMTSWAKNDPRVLTEVLKGIPMHRAGSPTEILGVLLFLLSDSARYVTGHSLVADGGSLLT
ncbi:SDR family NAD(P)-dependent oxidoreductase [Paenarthrobacter nicotinovorans]|uniref:SDR family NAD(P)-dependent oxidoreductase n=1 Tax=Paenarthrobacter nicotinovorans TaxID=29320 RepID=UPI0038284570